MDTFININGLDLVKADCVCRIGAIDAGIYTIEMGNGTKIDIQDSEYPRGRLVQLLCSLGASVR